MSEYAHSINEERVVFRLRAAKGDLKSCVLYYGDRSCRQNPVIYSPVKMHIKHTDKLFDWWEINFIPMYRRICYYFELLANSEDNKKILYYADSFSETLSHERSDVYQFPFIHRADIAKAPDWATSAIIYNIFPDSFATKECYISGQSSRELWNEKPIFGKRGGTIRGIAENANYLSNLGINCVYINPFFVAGQYHKYDVIDYYNVDPCFGTNDDFKKMVKVLKDYNIRVIVDGVFNHCGWNFFAFDDVIKKGKESIYTDWFYRLEYPVTRPDTMEEIPNYECFAYERLMPKMNTANPEVVEYFCDVCRHWLREYKIDGWRLDVAEETNDDFWRSFKKAAQEVNPEAFLIGEIWTNANHWLDGTMFHSAMNYDFRKHCNKFFAKGSIDAETFSSHVINMLMRYRTNLTFTQLNLLSSHDVSRFYSLCNEDKRRFKLAVFFQMCFVGIPSIYYGEEQGLTGMTEDEYRQPMKWDGDNEIYNFYKDVIKLRKNNIALSKGEYETVYTNDNLLVFRRSYNSNTITIAMNVDEKPTTYEGHKLEPFGYKILG